jgi:hypothetical protein
MWPQDDLELEGGAEPEPTEAERATALLVLGFILVDLLSRPDGACCLRGELERGAGSVQPTSEPRTLGS